MSKPGNVVSTIDPKTGSGWKFKSRLFEFGKAWLDDIDRLIAKNDSAMTIRTFLVNKYKGPLSIPDRKTISAYIKWRKEVQRVSAGSAVRILKETERTEADLKSMMARLRIADADVSNRKDLLENIIRFLLVRTEAITQVQENLMDPRFESTITKHLGLVKDVTDTLLKMEGQTGIHDYIARRIIELFLQEMAPLIKQAAEDTYGPDQLKAFLERVGKGYKKIDFSRLRRDATTEAAAVSNDEVISAINKSTGPNAR